MNPNTGDYLLLFNPRDRVPAMVEYRGMSGPGTAVVLGENRLQFGVRVEHLHPNPSDLLEDMGVTHPKHFEWGAAFFLSNWEALTAEPEPEPAPAPAPKPAGEYRGGQIDLLGLPMGSPAQQERAVRKGSRDRATAAEANRQILGKLRSVVPTLSPRTAADLLEELRGTGGWARFGGRLAATDDGALEAYSAIREELRAIADAGQSAESPRTTLQVLGQSFHVGGNSKGSLISHHALGSWRPLIVINDGEGYSLRSGGKRWQRTRRVGSWTEDPRSVRGNQLAEGPLSHFSDARGQALVEKLKRYALPDYRKDANEAQTRVWEALEAEGWAGGAVQNVHGVQQWVALKGVGSDGTVRWAVRDYESRTVSERSGSLVDFQKDYSGVGHSRLRTHQGYEVSGIEDLLVRGRSLPREGRNRAIKRFLQAASPETRWSVRKEGITVSGGGILSRNRSLRSIAEREQIPSRFYDYAVKKSSQAPTPWTRDEIAFWTPHIHIPAKDQAELDAEAAQARSVPEAVQPPAAQPPAARPPSPEGTIHLSWVAGEGYTVRGDTRPVKEAIKAATPFRWRWYSRGKFWYALRQKSLPFRPSAWDQLVSSLRSLLPDGYGLTLSSPADPEPRDPSTEAVGKGPEVAFLERYFAGWPGLTMYPAHLAEKVDTAIRASLPDDWRQTLPKERKVLGAIYGVLSDAGQTESLYKAIKGHKPELYG